MNINLVTFLTLRELVPIFWENETICNPLFCGPLKIGIPSYQGLSKIPLKEFRQVSFQKALSPLLFSLEFIIWSNSFVKKSYATTRINCPCRTIW